MKIEIKVELGQDELERAARLLEALRGLSEHVDLHVDKSAPVTPKPLTPVAAVKAGSVGTGRAAASGSPRPDKSGSGSLLSPLKGKEIPPQASEPPPSENVEKYVGPFMQLLHKLDDTPGQQLIEQVAKDVGTVLGSAKDGTALEGFQQALTNILYDKDTMAQGQSRLPYMGVVPLQQEQHKSAILDKLTREVMAALTSKREVTVDRQEFFVHAEIFATFVTIQHIKITSAVKTISRMLLAPALRSAGVTMLGKTVELCHDELVKDTSPEAMSQLREALAQVHEHVFIYDRNYVADYLGWQDLLLDTSVLHEAASSEAAYPPEAAGGATETAPALASGAGVPDGSSSQQAQAHLSLVAKASLGGHDSPVLAVAWAPTVGQGISTDRDGTILSWNPGQVSEVNRDKSPTHMFTSVDIMHDSALVLLAGTAKKNDAQAPPPVIASYSLAGGAFTEAGRCPLAGPKLHALSCIPGTHKLVTAERVGKDNVCCTYDATRMMGTAAASALQTFHVDKASLSSICALDSQLFVCGAGDGAVQLWDMRQNGRQLQISRPSSQGAKGGISSVSVADTFAAAGSANGSVRVWDIRQPGSKHVQSLSPDSSAVQCLRLCQGTANAAVATLMGMYFLHDLTSSSSPAVRTVGDASLLSAKGFPGPSAYHDLAWVYPTNVLFAGGEDQRVDVYVLENPEAAA